MSSPPTGDLLRLLATGSPPPAAATLEAHWRSIAALREEFSPPILRATACGFLADRLGYAFASGYQAALSALFAVGLHQVASLSVTESGGARPRDIRTRLEWRDGGWFLTGAKVFTTAPGLATVLFVAATTGEGPDGRPALKVARVPTDANGLHLARLDDLPFVPEVPHAGVEFQGVAVPTSAVLEGDGYARYVKPFRTVEDLHVNAAVLGYLLSLARRFDWPRPVREELLALVSTGCALAPLAPDAAETHLALAGYLGQVRRLVESSEPHFERVAPEERARWQRDRPLLQVAERVRAQRLESAWTQCLAGRKSANALV